MKTIETNLGPLILNRTIFIFINILSCIQDN